MSQRIVEQEQINRTIPPFIDRTEELNWLKEHKAEYANLWVALDGDKLLASGENHREVFQLARRKGVSRPLIVKVAPENQLPFVGW